MIYLIMGVSGAGKTTVGEALSHQVDCPFYDADEFHPPENIEKMSQGIPLTDRDRLPWLVAIKEVIDQHQQSQTDAVITCSALKQSYRNLLQKNTQDLIWIYLKGSYQQILKRLEKRSGHYMKPRMLLSQFNALEEPQNAIVIDINLSVSEITQTIILETQKRH